MINSKGKVKGLVTVTVRDCNGHVKYFKNGFSYSQSQVVEQLQLVE